jgi:GH15 family glucan-1,4-alpha-glucosidase
LAAHLYSREEKRFLRTIVPAGPGVFKTDMRVDASTYAPFYFGAFGPDDERIVGTMAAIEERLRVNTEVGGTARYEGDAYQKDAKGPAIPGNPWIICSLWLAQWRIARSRNRHELQEVLPLLRWASSKALPSGVLAEQIDPLDGKPVSVSPLTWSHAAFAASVLEYLEKLERIGTCPSCGMPLYAHDRKGRPHGSDRGS